MFRYHVPKHVSSHIDYITPGVKLMGNGGPQQKHTLLREDDLDSKASQSVDLEDLGGMLSKRSRARSSSTTKTIDPKFQGPLRFAEPVRPGDIRSGNLSLAQGCDTYVTPDCLRRRCCHISDS